MISSKELRKRTTNIYFAKRFSELIKEWKTKTGKTQKEFSDECYSNPNSIGNYKNGSDFPSPATIDALIRVFNNAGMNVTVEDFIPHTNDDAYHYDPSRAKGIQDHNREFAQKIGLSEGFMDFITNCTNFSDPEEGYPIWSPLALYPSGFRGFETTEKELEYLNDSMMVIEYHRRPLATTHAVSDDRSYTIQMKDGSSFLMSEIDLRILKDLQDKVVEMVKFLYFMRRKDMKIQEVKAIKQANPMTRDEKKKSIHIGHHELEIPELIAIDPYMQYLKFVDKNGKEV